MGSISEVRVVLGLLTEAESGGLWTAEGLGRRSGVEEQRVFVSSDTPPCLEI